MTFAPPALKAARQLLTDNLDMHPLSKDYPADLDPSEVGIVGDSAHAAGGTSYHLGKSDLTATAYSRRTARDKAGLSDAASAVDIGEFRVTTPLGTFTHRDFATWLVEQCQANAPDTRDVREVIYSPDGKIVLRYDRERGYASKPEPGEADDSHLFHDHVSMYRDAEFRYSLFNLISRWLVEIGVLGMNPNDEKALINRINSMIDMALVNPYGDSLKPEPNKLAEAINGITAGVKALADRPPVVAGPTDPAAIKAALLDPEVIAVYGKVIAEAVGEREAAADRARAAVLDGPPV